METFSRQDAIKMKEEIEQALSKVAKKYGANVKLGNIRYGDTLTSKVTFSKVSSNKHGEFVMTKEAKTFLLRAKGLGLREDVLNEKIRHQGSTYVVTGFNTRAKKYPITYTKDGRRMKSSVEYMKTFVRSGRPELFL